MKIKIKFNRISSSLIICKEHIDICGEVAKLGSDKTVVITDDRLGKKFKKLIDFAPICEIEHMRGKSLDELKKIFNFFEKNNITRRSAVVSFGGGKISDITGLAASLWKRGIVWVSVPTTFLAQIDASVGGKTAIDFNNTKNVIGSFYLPKLVLIDTDFIMNQNETFFEAMGELYKYIFISDTKTSSRLKKLLPYVLKKDRKAVKETVELCLKYKASVVRKDMIDINGIREVLNFGHTAAHPIEVIYDTSHGDAVVYGLIYALILSRNVGMLSDKKFDDFISLFKEYRPEIKLIKNDFSVFIKTLKRDKKNRGCANYFLLIDDNRKIKGKENIPISIIKKSWEELCKKY